MEHAYFQEKICPICGKTFCILNASDWAYKLLQNKYKGTRKKYYCSYKCYRKAGGDSGWVKIY